MGYSDQVGALVTAASRISIEAGFENGVVLRELSSRYVLVLWPNGKVLKCGKKALLWKQRISI